MSQMMTAPRALRLRRLVKARVEAEVAFSWKGAQEPAERVRLEANVALARKRFNDYIDHLVKSQEVK